MKVLSENTLLYTVSPDNGDSEWDFTDSYYWLFSDFVSFFFFFLHSWDTLKISLDLLVCALTWLIDFLGNQIAGNRENMFRPLRSFFIPCSVERWDSLYWLPDSIAFCRSLKVMVKLLSNVECYSQKVSFIIIFSIALFSQECCSTRVLLC